MQLQTKALVALERLGMIDGYTLRPLISTGMYANTWPEGRKCVDNRHHSSNKFFIRFLQSVAMEYRCYGSSCVDAPPVDLGDRCVELEDLLQSDV